MRAAVLALCLLIFVPSAHAAGWSSPHAFPAGGSPDWEPAPRAAISAGGSSLVAWSAGPGRLLASAGDTRGRFGAPVTVAREASGHAVAAGAIAYETRGGVYVAVRSGRGFRSRRVAASTGSEINGLAIAADPLGGWVVAERQFPTHGSGVPYRVRAFSVGPDGRRVGAVQDLGLGQFGIDARQTSALAVLPDGRAVLVFTREAPRNAMGPTPAVVTTRPHGGTFAEPAALSAVEELVEPRVTVSGDQAVLTAVASPSCGDAGCAGQPRVSVLGADGAPGPLSGPALANPRRAFGPWAASAGTIVFQLKTGVQPFSREAPVRASVTGGAALQTLTAQRTT